MSRRILLAVAISAFLGSTVSVCGTSTRPARDQGAAVSGSDAAVARWVAQLRQGDGAARWEAARALEQMGAAAAPALRALIAALRDEEPTVGRKAAEALAAIGKPAVALLLPCLQSADGYVRRRAAEALGRIRPTAKEAVLALSKVVGDFYKPARLEAIQALQRIGPTAAPAVDALVETLAHPDAQTRRHAAGALGGVGVDSEAVVRALAIVAGRDAHSYVANSAGAALKALGVPESRLQAVLANVGPEPRSWPPPVRQREPEPVTYATLADLQKRYPNARLRLWQVAGRPTYTLVDTPGHPNRGRGVIPRLGHIAVFDADGRPVYQKPLDEGTEGGPHAYSAPEIVPVPGRVIAYAKSSYMPKTHGIQLILVGIAPGGSKELALPYECSSSYPADYSSRVWVEDIDGDGEPEICRYFRRHYHMGGGKPPAVLLECRRWDTAKGAWQEDEKLAGRRQQKWRPPIRWHVRGTYDAKQRTVDLHVGIENAAAEAVTLTQPTPLLVEPRHQAQRIAPDPAFGFPLIVRAGRRWGRIDWPVAVSRRVSGGLVVGAGATVSCRFRLTVPAGQDVGGDFNLRLIGRARWGRFESTFAEQYSPRFGRDQVLPAKGGNTP